MNLEIVCKDCGARLPNAESISDAAIVAEAHLFWCPPRRVVATFNPEKESEDDEIAKRAMMAVQTRHAAEHTPAGRVDAGTISECGATVCIEAVARYPLLKLLVEA